MFRALAKYVGVITAAVLMAGGVAWGDPPAGPRADIGVAPRAAARADARADVRDNRLDRRAHRTPGELGLRLGNIADRGLAIANLVTDSVFYNVGIRPGDYIVSIDGHRLTGPTDFDQYLYANPGQPVQIVVWRNGADRTITVQPNALYIDTNANANAYDNELAWFGVQFDPQYANELYVSRVLPDSYAYRAGLRQGDVITNWNGQRVRSPQDFAGVIRDAKPGRVAFDYTRDSKNVQGNANFDRGYEYRAGYRGPGDRTAERDARPTGPSNAAPSNGNPQIANPPATAPGNERDNIPRLNPPANQHETTPTVNPPANPREPIPTVTPPAHAPNPSANPPVGRAPSTTPENHEASPGNAPAPPAPSGNVPRGR